MWKKGVLNLLLIFYLSLIFFTSIYAGSLEEIRKITGKSESNNKYIPYVSLAELVGNARKFLKDFVKFEAIFNGISTRGLDKWLWDEHYKIDSRYIKFRKKKWSSSRYVSLEVKDPAKKVKTTLLYLFLRNTKMDILKEISKGEKILITGFLYAYNRGKLWIEVKEIKVIGNE